MTVDLPDSNITEEVEVNNAGGLLASGSLISVPNVWGHVNLFARGAGQAVAQLDLTYGVDYQPFRVSEECARNG